MVRKRTIQDIASYLEMWRDVYCEHVDHIVAIAFPDVHQVHIPGLDQTEWEG